MTNDHEHKKFDSSKILFTFQWSRKISRIRRRRIDFLKSPGEITSTLYTRDITYPARYRLNKLIRTGRAFSLSRNKGLSLSNLTKIRSIEEAKNNPVEFLLLLRDTHASLRTNQKERARERGTFLLLLLLLLFSYSIDPIESDIGCL